MDKLHTVKKSEEFSSIIHNCKFVKNNTYVIYYKENNNQGNYRFGISVSKKLGNSVCRNKYKRQLRHIIDKFKKNYQNNVDYIIIIRNGYVNLNFESKEKEFNYLIEKINKIKEN